MWAVSERFLKALGKPHAIITEATFTLPNGEIVPVRIKSGSVSGDATANVRRTANLTVFGSLADYEMLSTPGGILRIDHGINFGTERELVPVFHGELTGGGQEMGDGSISARFGDMNVRVERCDFFTPFAPTVGAARVAVIADVITGAVPGASVSVTASDVGTVNGSVWDKSRLDAVRDLTRDGGTESFWRPDGSYLIRDDLTASTEPVWTITAGVGGTMKPGIERGRPMDKLYNGVIVRPSATDGGQGWDQQEVWITDPTNPRHPSKIGFVPYVWASPTASTAAAAVSAARKILDRLVGSLETLSFDSISNPALDAGDPVRIITPALGEEQPNILSHFIDSFNLNLVTGEMSLSTRSQVPDA